MLLTILLTILPFQNEYIPQDMQIWDHRGPEQELSLEELPPRESAFLIAALPDSYESKILTEIGYPQKTYSIPEWQQAIRAKGYTIAHSEVRHELAYFNDETEVKKWLEPVLTPEQIDTFLLILEKDCLANQTGGRIYFPYKRLVMIVEHDL